MNFEEFQMWLKRNICAFLPEEYKNAEVEIEPIVKLDDQYLALMIKKQDKKTEVIPTFNLFDLYRKFERKEAGLGEIVAYISHAVAESETKYPFIDPSVFELYEKAREHLFIRVNNIKDRQDILERVPHTLVEDLMITYHINFPTNDGSVSSSMITNDLMKKYGVTLDQLHKDALENSERLFPADIQPIENVIGSFMSDIEDRDSTSPQLLVITNSRMINGAAALFYPGVMDRISSIFSEDFYIVPSSIHECLALPVSTQADYHDLEQMVHAINEIQVPEAEQLGEKVYFYDVNEKTFEFACGHKEKEEFKFSSLETRISNATKDISNNQIQKRQKEEYIR